MNSKELKIVRRNRRKKHLRHRIFGAPERLRLTVFRSLNHIYAQIINDVDRKTLVSVSTLDKDVRNQISPDMKKIDQCKLIGEILARKAKEANIEKVAFDRNGYLYHGRVKALADAARQAGLNF